VKGLKPATRQALTFNPTSSEAENTEGVEISPRFVLGKEQVFREF
jgi:hypothetical protein